MKLMSCLILVLGLPLFAHADDDPNIIQPKDLPTTVYRAMVESGRGKMPVIDHDQAVAEAMKDNSGEEQCEAKIGDQISDFTTEAEQDGVYFTIRVQAPFRCQAPTTQTDLSPAAAKALFADIPVETKIDSRLKEKNVRILCYSTLDEICDGSVLIDYNDHQTCEITDADTGKLLSVLNDINGPTAQQVQGAVKLMNDLPIYIDGRRDDSPSANCTPHQYGKLKGLSRQAAKLSCTQVDGKGPQCHLEGMVRVN